jgi:hypothetical protein
MLKITGWIMSSWRNFNKIGFDHTKPYNPILGEFFKCAWDFDDSTTNYLGKNINIKFK